MAKFCSIQLAILVLCLLIWEQHIYNETRITSTLHSKRISAPKALGAVKKGNNFAFSMEPSRPLCINSSCIETKSISRDTSMQNATLIIATTPRTSRNFVALWTLLECLTFGVDRVVLATSHTYYDSEIENIATEARQKLMLNIKVYYFINDRYDVGLWCDAISVLQIKGVVYLLNDSVFALRVFKHMHVAVTTLLKSKTAPVVLAMAGSNTMGDGYDGALWIESYYRGFSPMALQTFVNYSCSVAATKNVQHCQTKVRAKFKKKRCIVDYHEIGLSRQYETDTVYHLYTADEQDPDKRAKRKTKQMWNQNYDIWHKLVSNEGFPLAKVNQQNQIPWLGHPMLRQCTHLLSVDLNHSIASAFNAHFL